MGYMLKWRHVWALLRKLREIAEVTGAGMDELRELENVLAGLAERRPPK